MIATSPQFLPLAVPFPSIFKARLPAKARRMSSTSELLKQLEQSLEAMYSTLDLSIGDGAPFLNAENLVVIQKKTDLDRFKKEKGCYFIFTTLPRDRVPTFRDYRLFDDHSLTVGGLRFRCIYNGKHNDIKSRLRQHLFSGQTVEAVKMGRAPRLSATGALSLEAITLQELAALRQAYPGCLPPSGEGNLIHCRQLADTSPASIKLQEARLLNGINITEPQWAGSSFGVIVVPVPNPMLQLLLENAFRKQHGWPALSKR